MTPQRCDYTQGLGDHPPITHTEIVGCPLCAERLRVAKIEDNEKELQEACAATDVAECRAQDLEDQLSVSEDHVSELLAEVECLKDKISEMEEDESSTDAVA